jgi:hypothetical protein
MFTLLKYTPNLKYLNVQSKQSDRYQIPLNKINIKLEQLYLTLKRDPYREIDFDPLINGIKQFSSSLICLSLNLVALEIADRTQIPFNSTKLQQFLQSMTELKQFHLYAQLGDRSIDTDIILSQFKNQYWFDHNWSFGMHTKYLYTLPFHFDHLYEFPQDFDTVKSNNPEILINNPRVWYNVKSIELFRTSEFDRHFVKELQMKMPKLNLIKFINFSFVHKHETQIFSEIDDKQEKIDVRLDNVRTIQFFWNYTSIDNEKEWLINVTPNIKQLILPNLNLNVTSNELGKILEKKIEQLDIHINSDLINLTEKSYVYFSNVQYINFCIFDHFERLHWHASIIMKILTNFKNLNTLCVYFRQTNNINQLSYLEEKLRNFIEYLDMNEIMKNYQMEHFQTYCLFLKREFNDMEVENDVSRTLKNSSFFSRLIRLFSRKKRS